MPRVVAVVSVLGLSATCLGIINPNFTPKHLVDQSDLVLAGPIEATDKPLEWKLTASRQLKGSADAAQVIDLAGAKSEQLEDLQAALREAGNEPAVLFAGTFNEQKLAYLSVSGRWLAMKAAGKGRWKVEGLAPQLSATYAGGSDMLAAMAEYLIKDPDAGVPVTAGVRWLEHRKLGKVPGEVAGIAAADFGGSGPAWLFVASTAGDRLYRPDKENETLTDVTAKAKLDSRSRRFAWVDVNRDGVADLVSWDGAAISVRLAGAEGTFQPAGEAWSARLQEQCIGLAACSLDGSPGLLVSTPTLPLLLKATSAGWKLSRLPAGKGEAAAGQGAGSACIVADFDNDGYADVLRPAEAGGLLWKGSAGGFSAPEASAVGTGGGPAVAALGDFDGNGALDIFLGGAEKNSLWENDGAGRFVEVLRRSGSMSYKCPAGVADAVTADLNHDGRQDLCLAYARADLLYHFSRGFRCFGEEGEVRLAGAEVEAGSERLGQKALAVGDFNGDSSGDLAVVLSDGELQVYFNDQLDVPGVRLRMPKGLIGPVTASCWRGEGFQVCLGAVSVTGHSPVAYLSGRYPGALTVRYRLPGQAARSTRITAEDSAVEFVLGGAVPTATRPK